MAPSTLNLFILTFNCAKNFINPPVFAAHLHGALTEQNTADLPDLVVFSLQEVAPLSYAFIGSYFLNPYYARFGEALNLASAKVLATADSDDGHASFSAAAPRGRTPPYTLVRAKNVGMTAILMYARDPTSIRKIEEAECGFGAADMGNKGAVGLRVTWSGHTDETGPDRTTELTFVATHLAAMEWNLKKRNSNWRSIVAGLTFANPRSILPGTFPVDQATPTVDRSGSGDSAPRLPTGDSPDPSEEEPDETPSSGEDEEDATHPLLPHPQLPTTDEATLAALQSISIYKPTSHLFVAGDLNYRISSTTPPPLSTFPSFDPTSEHHHATFLPRDQLTRERRAGRALHGLAEAPVAFGPTYKFDVLESAAGAANEAAVRAGDAVNGVPEVPWRFAPHRWPGWCDRVLYLDVPAWVSSSSSNSSEGGGEEKVSVQVGAYDALPLMACSDHRAVFFRARVPVLGEEEMRPPVGIETEAEGSEEDGDGGLPDPRIRMPVPVDVHAWERRAAARRREMVVGWTAFLWSTREGAILLATLLALGVGSWWLLRVW